MKKKSEDFIFDFIDDIFMIWRLKMFGFAYKIIEPQYKDYKDRVCEECRRCRVNYEGDAYCEQDNEMDETRGTHDCAARACKAFEPLEEDAGD